MEVHPEWFAEEDYQEAALAMPTKLPKRMKPGDAVDEPTIKKERTTDDVVAAPQLDDAQQPMEETVAKVEPNADDGTNRV